MKKLKYNVTDKYTGIKYNPEGTSKEDGYNCLGLCLDFCRNEMDLPYTFEDKISGDISWENITKLFKDNPDEVFKELEKHFTNYYEMILPHQMRKGDIVVIDNGDIKTPCIFVGGNKILVTRKDKAKVKIKDSDDKPITIKDGVKVVSLQGLSIYQVYRIKEERKITTKAVYKLGDNPEDFELLDEESYQYDGDVAECYGWEFIVMVIAAIISLISAIWMYLNMPDKPGESSLGRIVNTRSTKEPLKVVYGLQRVGGNDVFMETVGSFHKDLYICQTLSEGECEGIYQVGGVDQIQIDDHLPSYFGSKVSYQFYSGSGTQTYDTVINGIKGAYTDNMRHTCYIRWKLKFDKDLYVSGKPTRSLDLKGVKVSDFRDSTAEIAWSQNAVLCTYDMFTNGRYGLNIPTEYIDEASWSTAANYFDTKGWKFNYITSGSKNIWATAQDMMAHYRGVISWFDGKYYLLISDLNEESSVMTIEDEHIVQNEDGKAEIRLVKPNRFDTPKGIKVKFLDAEKDYTEDEILIGEEYGVIKNTSYYGYTDRKTACDLATYELERARLNRTISGTFRDDCIELAPHDLVTFNSTALAIADQAMRVLSSSYAGNGLISLSLQYESEELYDDDYDASIEGVYTCTLPNPNVVIQIQNPQMTEETFYYRLRTESRLHITFTVPDEAAWFKHCEVWQAIVDSGDPVPADADYEHQFNTTNNFNIDHVEQGQIYYIVLIPVSIFGVKETFANAPKLSASVVGNSSAPESLTYLSAIPSSNSLTLFSDKLDDPDIEIYEFRLGSQWNGGIFLSSKRSPQETLPGVKPGTFTFWANTKGSNGIYGVTPQSATAKMHLPIGWSLSDSFTDDYSDSTGNTFINTEQTTYAAEDYLMCSHNDSTAGIDLSGSYESDVFDTGGLADDYYMYLEADIVVTGAGTDWDDVIPVDSTAVPEISTIWTDVGITTRSWAEIFTVDEAPKVNITIYYKETIGASWSEMKNAEILSSIVKARYFKVKIEIEDPSSEIYAKIEHFILNIYTKT